MGKESNKKEMTQEELENQQLFEKASKQASDDDKARQQIYKNMTEAVDEDLKNSSYDSTKSRKYNAFVYKDKDDPVRYYDKGMLKSFVEQVAGDPDLFAQKPDMKITDKNAFYNELAKEDQIDWQLDQVDAQDPLSEGEDPLARILVDVSQYINTDRTAAKISLTDHPDQPKFQAENLLIKRIYRRLNKLQDELLAEQEQLNVSSGKKFDAQEEERRKNGSEPVEKAEQSKAAEEIRDAGDALDSRMFAVASLLNYFDMEVFGKLGYLPDQQEHDDDRHIDYSGKYLGTRDWEKSLFHYYENADAQGKQNFPVQDEIEHDHRDAPMFPHSPTASDIKQAHIGDCYLMATLGSLAHTHPERIKEMIRDNRNGTATVRLFRRTASGPEPLFVTVDKVRSASQASNSEWVQTIERAIAVSGLRVCENYDAMNQRLAAEERPVPENIDEIYDQISQIQDPGERLEFKDKYPWIFDKKGNLTKWEPNLSDIDGGKSIEVIGMLTGVYDEYSAQNSSKAKMRIYPTPGTMTPEATPHKDSDLQPIPITQKYSGDEKQMFRKIEEACASNKVVTASSCSSPKGDTEKVVGIYKSHAYSILGTERINIDGHERLFIKLRNPHGTSGRTYVKEEVNGKLQLRAVENTNLTKDPVNSIENGINYVELSHFTAEFKEYSVFNIPDTPIEKDNKRVDEETRTLTDYCKTFREIRNYLDHETPFWSKSSKEFDAVKKTLNELAKSRMRDPMELKLKIDELEKKVKAYDDHVKAKPLEGNRTREMKIGVCEMIRHTAAIADRQFAGLTEALKRGEEAKALKEGLQPETAPEVPDKNIADPTKDTVIYHEGPTAALKREIADRIRQDLITKAAADVNNPASQKAADFARNNPEKADRQILRSKEFQQFASSQENNFVNMYLKLKNGDISIKDLSIRNPANKIPDRTKKTYGDILAEQQAANAGTNKQNAPAKPAANPPAANPSAASSKKTAKPQVVKPLGEVKFKGRI